jgi:hypothetical protein
VRHGGVPYAIFIFKTGEPQMSINVMTIHEGKMMIDYAYPCMMAEKALKKAHDAVLDNDLDAAIAEALVAMSEAKLMLSTLRHMKAMKEVKERK